MHCQHRRPTHAKVSRGPHQLSTQWEPDPSSEIQPSAAVCATGHPQPSGSPIQPQHFNVTCCHTRQSSHKVLQRRIDPAHATASRGPPPVLNPLAPATQFSNTRVSRFTAQGRRRPTQRKPPVSQATRLTGKPLHTPLPMLHHSFITFKYSHYPHIEINTAHQGYIIHQTA